MDERDAWIRQGRRLQPQVFVLDVDGTLLDSQHRVTDRTKAAVTACVSSGSDVVLASSRPPLALLPILHRLELEQATVIASQGAVIGETRRDGRFSVELRREIPLEVAHAIAARATALGITVNWFTTSGWYASIFDGYVRTESQVVGLRPQIRATDSIDEAPDKLMFMSDAGDLAERLSLPATVQAVESNPGYLEVTRLGVSKGSALETYCRTRRIAPSKVAAIGDGANDIEMFDLVGTSIAPANASSHVRRLATLTTRSNDEDGVAMAMEYLMGLSNLPPV